MSAGWSESDKRIAQKLAARAQSAAEAEALRLFRDYEVKTAEDLWQLELKIREWRRDRWHVFTLAYARAEEMIADWVARGWIAPAELDAFSPARRERIWARAGYTR